MASYGKYREEGSIILVEILSDKTNDNGREVELKCLQVIRPVRGGVPLPNPDPIVGQVWSVWAGPGSGPYCGWSLEVLEAGAPELKGLPKAG